MAFQKRNTVDGNFAKRVAWEQVQRELQRRRRNSLTSYSEWLPQACPDLNWSYPHMRYIAEKMDAFSRGEIKRLMIWIPPQHGKSSVVTVRYPVFLLEKNPATRIIVTGYGADLAESFSKQIRALVRARNIVELDQETQSVPKWLTKQGGGIKAIGVEGAVTGFSGDVIIIDDPVKNREEANSKAKREATWNWFTNDLYTRQQANTPMVVIQCMTGDTPVLMADGTEKMLRDVKIREQVATYDDGILSTSVVLNHKNNGHDLVFKIKTISGRIVRANLRHPFLIEENGEVKWIRLKDLITGQKIVIVKDNGVSGKAKLALLKSAKSPSVQGDTAPHTMVRKCGQMDIVLPQSIQNQDEARILNTDTESPRQSTMQCSQDKVENVQYVNKNHQALIQEHTGTENSALTIVTKPIQSEHSFATTVISQSDIQKPNQQHLQLQNICDFTTEEIISISPDSVEQVYDVEIEGTENFIANGCVSHNTRWHEDDLSGRLLEENEMIDDPNYRWTVVSLPAICEGTDPADYPIQREVGDALCPELHPIQQLREFERVMGSDFAALYQQRPAPAEGDVWKKSWFCEGGDSAKPLITVNKFPANKKITQVWDTSLETKERNDPNAMVEGCLGDDGFYYIAAMVNEKMEFPQLVHRMRSEMERYDSVEVCVEDKANAKPARQQLKLLGIPLIEIPTGGNDKRVRAKSVTHYAEGGLIRFVNIPGNCNNILFDQLMMFDNGKHDDLHDAFVHLLRRLCKKNDGWSKETLKEIAASVR